MEKNQRVLGRPRKEDGDMPTKEIILNIATEMFLEKGYPLVSMDDVANKCDVTKATVYYYYKTKAELFTDAMVELLTRIRQKSASLLKTDKPLKDQFFHILKAHLEATTDIDITALMREAEISLPADQFSALKQAEKALYSELENALTEAMDKGELPSNNPHFATLVFVNLLTVRNAMDETFKQSFTTTDELAKYMINFYWNGLAGEMA